MSGSIQAILDGGVAMEQATDGCQHYHRACSTCSTYLLNDMAAEWAINGNFRWVAQFSNFGWQRGNGIGCG